MFNKNTSYTLEQITIMLFAAVKAATGFDAGMAIGRKIVIKNPLNSLSVEIALDTAGTSGHYSMLRLRVINYKTQNCENTANINITDAKYRTPGTSLGGGYFWTYDNSFYGYVPDFKKIVADLVAYTEMMEVTSPIKKKAVKKVTA